MGNYWQIASGDRGRDYSKYCLRYGMAFAGSDRAVEIMNSEVRLGDRVVLKRGISEVIAAGTVVERDGVYKGCRDQDWLEDFDGWTLPAYCYVDWKQPKNGDADKLGVKLRRGTMSRVGLDSHSQVDAICSAGEPVHPRNAPARTKLVTDPELVRHLIAKGVSPAAAETLTQAVSRVRLLADFYWNEVNWKHVREHEVRTFLVVPLLLALGWPPQQLKIEHSIDGRQRADILGFRDRFTSNGDNRCCIIIETKGFESGLDYADQQAKAYAEALPDCRTLVVTNGYCYKAFTRSDSCSDWRPHAYINLRAPRTRYPLDPDSVDGAVEAIRRLLPP